jgi:hypothetical protein
VSAKRQPAQPLALGQDDVDRLTSGDGAASGSLASRLEATRPSRTAAEASGARARRAAQAGPVDLSAAELRALAKGGNPRSFVRRLATAEEASQIAAASRRRRAVEKDAPTERPDALSTERPDAL